MKRYICIIAVVIALALTSIAVISGNQVTALASFMPTIEVVLASDHAVDVRLVATGEGMNMSWYVMGQFEFPGYIGVHRLVIESCPDGPIRCVGVLLVTDLQRASDSTTLETFAFGIHVGVLRRVIEADGMARFTIYGQNTHVTVDMRPDGEAVILDALLKPGEN